MPNGAKGKSFFNIFMKLEINKDPIISASEVGNFLFCKNSFLLKRAGIQLEDYQSESVAEKEVVKKQLELISAGRITHKEITEKAEKILKSEELANTGINLALMLLFVVIVLIVILLI